jgi:hypothetical protein
VGYHTKKGFQAERLKQAYTQQEITHTQVANSQTPQAIMKTTQCILNTQGYLIRRGSSIETIEFVLSIL